MVIQDIFRARIIWENFQRSLVCWHFTKCSILASVERWGRALVVVVERPAVADLPFLASILEGMLESASETHVRCMSLGRDGATVRVLVAGELAITRARGMLDAGATWGDVLACLQRKGGGA